MPQGKAQNTVSGVSSRLRFFDCIPMPKSAALPVDFSVGLPFSAHLVPTNSIDAAAVISGTPLVHHVGLLGHIAKVGYSVIARITVNVVNHVCGPFAVVNGPTRTVGSKAAPKKRATFAADPIFCGKSDLSGKLSIPASCIGSLPANPFMRKKLRGPFSPRKVASLWIVIEKLAAKFWGDIGADSHAKEPFVWSGPREGATSLAARFFYQNHPLFAKLTRVRS